MAVNWARTILDGIMVSILFNAVVALGFLLLPQAYSTMFPREIRRAAAPYVNRRDVRTMYCILVPLYLLMFLYWAFSARFSGVNGFWNLFWTGYVEMLFVNASDFLILDCWLSQKVRHMIRGAEDCRAWARGEWLKTLAIPEHLLAWPLVVCPLTGLIVAGMGLALGAL